MMTRSLYLTRTNALLLLLLAVFLNIATTDSLASSTSLSQTPPVHNGKNHSADGHAFQVCVNYRTVHERHGIHVASWRWSELRSYVIITCFIILAALAKLGFHHAHFLSSKLPESCLLIILGVFMGVITNQLTVVSERNVDVQYNNGSHVPVCEESLSAIFPKFDSELFFLVLLPPIILEASYSLHDRIFANNVLTVLLYAVVGTLFNMFIIGPALYFLAISGWMGSTILSASTHFDITSISLVAILTFSALIVAVDPVAVLAIFQEVGVNKKLYFLVFGESLLNDAVTVVLYNSMVAFSGMAADGVAITVDQVALAVVSFWCVALGGLLIGIVYGLLTALITKFTEDVRVVEPLSLLLMAYLSYISAELVHFSGIIAMVGCGVVQAHYAMRNISKNSYITIKYFIAMASSTSDTIIFMFLGMMLVSGAHVFHVGFAFWTLLLCLAVRFVGVYMLTALANLRRSERIGKEEQFIMAYGGLRGAVGFSLAVMLEDTKMDKDTVNVFITTTLFIVLFTVFVQGSTIKLLVNLFNIKLDSVEQKKLMDEVASSTFMNITTGIEEILGHHDTNMLQLWLERFDERYLQSWLVNYQSDTSLRVLHDELALQDHYANLYGPASVIKHNTLIKSVSSGTPIRLSVVSDPGDLVVPQDLSPETRRSTGVPLSRPDTLSRAGPFRVSFRHVSEPQPPVHEPSAQVEHAVSIEDVNYDTSMTSGMARYRTNSTLPEDRSAFRNALQRTPYYQLHHRHSRSQVNDHRHEVEQHLQRRRMTGQRFSLLAHSLMSGTGPAQLQTCPAISEETKRPHVQTLFRQLSMKSSSSLRNRSYTEDSSSSKCDSSDDVRENGTQLMDSGAPGRHRREASGTPMMTDMTTISEETQSVRDSSGPQDSPDETDEERNTRV